MSSWTMHLSERPQTWKRTAGRGKRRYSDPTYAAYKALLQVEARNRGCPNFGAKPVSLVVQVTLKSWSGQGDVDNYAKAVMDALEGVAFDNDRQVRRLVASKVTGDHEGLTVTVGEEPA